MSTNLKDIKNDLLSLKDLYALFISYEQISATRVRKIKKSVLNTRDFLQGLSDYIPSILYEYNKDVYKKALGKLEPKKPILAVLVSSNTGLYGDVIRKTFDLFTKEKNEKADVAIFGKVGKKLFDSNFPGQPYEYHDMSDVTIDETIIKVVIEKALQYETIEFFHPMFKNVLLQEPQKTKIDYNLAMDLKEISSNSPVRFFIFDPDAPSVYEFFQKQFLSNLLEQVFFESNLSKYSSRMISLYKASENVKDLSEKGKMTLLRKKKKLTQKKQMSALAGVLFCK